MKIIGNSDDMFDFSEEIFGESPHGLKNTTPPVEKDEPKLDYKNEVHTAYILVNALLNLLIQKGYIKSHEVNSIVAELHEQFMKRKRG